jgi:hypothetical protein
MEVMLCDFSIEHYMFGLATERRLRLIQNAMLVAT